MNKYPNKLFDVKKKLDYTFISGQKGRYCFTPLLIQSRLNKKKSHKEQFL